MADNNGWIKLYRAILDNPVVTKDSDHFFVWCYLILKATHKPISAMFGGERITLLPGQLITGRNKIASATKVNPSKVKRIINLFKTEQQIDQQSKRYGSLITIVNWSEYQNCDQQNDQQVTNERPTSDQPVTTIQEHKNIKNEKNEINNTPKPPEGARMEIVRQVVNHLNLRTGKNYHPTTRVTQSKIIARINEGFTVDDFKKVIDVKAMEWMNTEQEKYLRPETLFGSKFEGYLNQRPERKKMNPVEIARAMDEAERRRQYDEGAGCPDVHQGFSGIPQYLPGNE